MCGGGGWGEERFIIMNWLQVLNLQGGQAGSSGKSG